MSHRTSGEAAVPRHFHEQAHLSFSSGTYLGIYHIGVVQAFKDFASKISQRKVLGSSAGALAGCCLVCDVPVEKAINAITKMTVHCRSFTVGALDPRFNISDLLRKQLYEILPSDAHLRANGKLFIAVTRASTLKHRFVSLFDSLDEFVDALMASCFIPFFFGIIPPKLKGVSYIDGGTRCRIPVNDDCTITVSPIRRHGAIITPRRDLNNMLGQSLPAYVRRFFRMLLAPAPAELLDLCEQGYVDAIDFLLSNNLILCSKCWDILEQDGPSGNERSQAFSEEQERKKKCPQCLNLQSAASASRFPKDFYRAVEKAAENERQRVCHRWKTSLSTSALLCAFVLIMLYITTRIFYFKLAQLA